MNSSVSLKGGTVERPALSSICDILYNCEKSITGRRERGGEVKDNQLEKRVIGKVNILYY